MLNMNSKPIIFTLSVLVILLLSSIVPTGLSTEIPKETNKGTLLQIQAPANRVISTNYNIYSTGELAFNDTEDIIVSGLPGNESYPSMVLSGYKALVAYEYESEGVTHVYFRNSLNYGQSWSGGYSTFDSALNTFSPSLCIKPFSKKAFCAAVSSYNDSGLLYDVEVPDIDYITELNSAAVDWSEYGFWDFSKPDVIYNSDPSYPDVPFITTVIGSTTFEDGPCNDSIMFFYRTPNADSYTIAWDSGIEHCSNVSTSFDSSSKTIYGACEFENETIQGLLFFYDNPLKWTPDSSLKNKLLVHSEKLMHPQIFSTDSQIYIVAETDNTGIVLYRSPNHGGSWYSYNVTKDILPPEAKPKCPVVYANDTRLFCVFFESGNISITDSANNGNSWSVPVQINSQNNSVVENYRYSCLPDETHVLWTDNRNGNLDIYSDLRSLPEVDMAVIQESVNITRGEFKFLPTNNWINFTVINKGNAYIENVPIEITYTCINETKTTKYPGYILYLDGFGAEKSFEKPLFRITLKEFLQALRSFAGLQNITVTVDPEGIYNDAHPEDNSATLEVSYADIFPYLSFVEKIFVR